MEALITAGTEVTCKNNGGLIPLQVALASKDFLFRKFCDLSPLVPSSTFWCHQDEKTRPEQIIYNLLEMKLVMNDFSEFMRSLHERGLKLPTHLILDDVLKSSNYIDTG